MTLRGSATEWARRSTILFLVRLWWAHDNASQLKQNTDCYDNADRMKPLTASASSVRRPSKK